MKRGKRRGLAPEKLIARRLDRIVLAIDTLTEAVLELRRAVVAAAIERRPVSTSELEHRVDQILEEASTGPIRSSEPGPTELATSNGPK